MNNVVLRLPVLCLVLLSTACASEDKVPANQPFELHVGETRAVEGAQLSVKFVGVENDSRCPTGVSCVAIP